MSYLYNSCGCGMILSGSDYGGNVVCFKVGTKLAGFTKAGKNLPKKQNFMFMVACIIIYSMI